MCALSLAAGVAVDPVGPNFQAAPAGWSSCSLRVCVGVCVCVCLVCVYFPSLHSRGQVVPQVDLTQEGVTVKTLCAVGGCC